MCGIKQVMLKAIKLNGNVMHRKMMPNDECHFLGELWVENGKLIFRAGLINPNYGRGVVDPIHPWIGDMNFSVKEMTDREVSDEYEQEKCARESKRLFGDKASIQ